MEGASVGQFFQSLPSRLDRDAADGVAAVYQFDLSGPQGGQYYLVIEQGECGINEGIHSAPDVTISLTAEDCLGFLSGRLEGVSAFLSGRVRVSGDLVLAMQLKTIFPSLP